MSERYEPHREPYREPYRPAGGWTPDEDAARQDPDDWREHTTPNMAAVPPLPAAGPTAAYPAVGGSRYPGYQGEGTQQPQSQGYQGDPGYQGYPGHQGAGPAYPGEGYRDEAYPGDPYAGGAGAVTTPDYTGRPVAFRRPDGVAGLLLVLAGIAAGASLVLHWVTASDVTGLGLMRSAWHQLKSSPSGLVDTGLWQPVAAVAGGLVLFVLGWLLFVPARTHRTLGLLGLLVSIGAGAGLLIALSGAGWHVGRFQIGFWLAVAVPVLGVIGSLKAMMTGPRLGNPTARG